MRIKLLIIFTAFNLFVVSLFAANYFLVASQKLAIASSMAINVKPLPPETVELFTSYENLDKSKNQLNEMIQIYNRLISYVGSQRIIYEDAQDYFRYYILTLLIVLSFNSLGLCYLAYHAKHNNQLKHDAQKTRAS